MDLLLNFLRSKKLEDESKSLPKEKEWYLLFSGMITRNQRDAMFEKKLQTSKLNSFLIGVFALTGTFISAYETELYLEVNQMKGTSTQMTYDGLKSAEFLNYTAEREDSVNFGLRMIVTFTTIITSSQL